MCWVTRICRHVVRNASTACILMLNVFIDVLAEVVLCVLFVSFYVSDSGDMNLNDIVGLALRDAAEARSRSRSQFVGLLKTPHITRTKTINV